MNLLSKMINRTNQICADRHASDKEGFQECIKRRDHLINNEF